MRELRSKLSVAWRCAPGVQKLLAVTVLVVLLGGVVAAVRGGSDSTQTPAVRAAATVDEPAFAVPTAPATAPEPSSLPTTTAPASTAPAPSVSGTPASAAPTTPTSATDLETASAPDSAAASACATFRTAVEPVIRQAVDKDDLAPASALIRAGRNPQSPWSRLTSAATVAAVRAPALQQHITSLGQDIAQANSSLTLTNLGSDVDAIDMDCGLAPTG